MQQTHTHSAVTRVSITKFSPLCQKVQSPPGNKLYSGVSADISQTLTIVAGKALAAIATGQIAAGAGPHCRVRDCDICRKAVSHCCAPLSSATGVSVRTANPSLASRTHRGCHVVHPA